MQKRSGRWKLAAAVLCISLAAFGQQSKTSASGTAAQQQSGQSELPPSSLTPPANATTPAPPPSQLPPTTVIRTTVNEVNLIFTATDKHGHYIKDLKEDEIRVLDDHKPVENFTSFASETDLPLRVGLLIDASSSIRERFKFEQEAAIEFLNDIIRPKTDKAFVVGFDTVPSLEQDFTNNTEKLAEGVHAMRPGGGTALYDALYYACREKLWHSGSGQPVRRAVILVSDGEDNQSRVLLNEAIAMAQRADVIVYTISTNTSGLELRGDKILEAMAEETGGRYFAPFKIEDVANAFSAIQDELRSQYLLAYKPPDFRADGSYRPIEISCTDKHIRLRARKGYYAPSQ